MVGDLTMKKIYLLACLAIFAACSDDNPFDTTEDDLDDTYYYANRKVDETDSDFSKELACRKGTSSHTASWCCSNYGYQCYNTYSSSSMSESEKCYYGTGELSDSYCCSNYGYQCSNIYSSSSMSESEKCRLGTSLKSDSYCCSYYGYRCAYVSSSSTRSSSSTYSSSSSATYYLTSAKSMKITLTYYKQLSSNWDGLDNAGDPEVSFTIYTYSDGVLGQTINTVTFIDKQDTRSWSGSVTKSYTINKGTDQIKICPKVIDEDISEHDNYSSGKCFSTSNIGYLKSTDIKEQEDYNSNYDLEWEWYLL